MRVMAKNQTVSKSARSSAPGGELLLGVAFSCVVVLGCGGSSKRAQTDFSPENLDSQITAGQSLYEEHCAHCHGAEGRNGEAPPLVGQDALPETPRKESGMRTTNFETARDVADFTVEQMPPGGARQLSIEEHYSVLSYLLSQSGKALERPLTPTSAPGIQLDP